MPNIPTYNVPENEGRLQVPQGGSAALANAGLHVGRTMHLAATSLERGIDQLGTGIQQGLKTVDDAQTADQVPQIPLLIAQDQAGRMQDLNNLALTTEPNDLRAALGKYSQEQLSGAKEEFLSNFTTPRAYKAATQAWDRHEAEITNHVSAMSIRASSDAAQANLIKAGNQFAANAAQDPSLLDANLALTDATIGSTTGSPDSPAARAIKGKIVESAFRSVAFGTPDGLVRPDPDAAQAMLDSGKYDAFLNQDHAKATVQLARHLTQAAETQNAAAQTQIAQQQSTAATVQHLDRFTANSPNFGFSVMHDPALTDNDKAALINMSTRLTSGVQPTTNALTMDHMLGRITSNDMPTPAQVMGQVTVGNLSLGDAQWLLQQNSSPAVHQLSSTLNTAKGMLMGNRGSGVVTPAGVEAYQNFQKVAVAAFRAGAPLDPKQLPDLVEQFKPTAADAVAATQARSAPALTRGGAVSSAVDNVSNNNFANMRASGGGWQRFSSAEAGISAISSQLDRYASRGLDTVRDIVSTWAPPNENPTASLVAQAAQRLGVSPDQKIDVKVAKKQLIAALIQQEHGHIPARAVPALMKFNG